ncbi:DUF1254 domain-containing protein [Arthrobacter sp. A2-55]|uniref:DUF1254 domain-containing protein n=1 Tax=Arthrobacter sp. A2-55 TaxID=2897337 RepID=UPI0021CD5749|nr:DUF1254 domain-containing protein [Arthrobacter sp. A2-55]MCU6482168.1 DUF1254 domain-containing protein [Arthrobacter sp. A2-55]
MNRLILKYATPVIIVILAIFAWVIYRRVAEGGLGAIIPLAVTAAIVWLLGGFVFIYFWPRITVGGFKRIFEGRGLGGGPIPVNTIYAVPESPFQSASSGSVIATGTDDLLYLGGWLDVKGGPYVLHMPAMDGRYCSVQFTDPTSGANFAYVGKRTTGTAAGDFLLCESNWAGDTPAGMSRIDVPHHAALLIGRVFVANENDRPAAYALAKQIQLTSLKPERER